MGLMLLLGRSETLIRLDLTIVRSCSTISGMRGDSVLNFFQRLSFQP